MDHIYRHRKHIVTRDIAGETLLVPIQEELADMQRLFALEGVSAFIWKRLDGDRTLDDILDLVAGRFDVDRHRGRARPVQR